jgi:predicted Zn-dependent protease
MFKNILTIFLCLLLITTCATTSTGRNQLTFISNQELEGMGLQAFDDLKQQKTISSNHKYQQFVQCIALAITHEVGGQWEVVVFEDSSLNAFALPGNKIGVHSGLIELVDNQHQLATVLGHEVAHVRERHSNERMSQEKSAQIGISLIQAVAAPQSQLGKTAISVLGIGAQYGIIMPFSRLHESEADIVGLELMAKAGFNPQESISLWQKMDQASQGQQPAEFLSTHPSHETRIEELQAHLAKALHLQQQANQAGKMPQCSKQ